MHNILIHLTSFFLILILNFNNIIDVILNKTLCNSIAQNKLKTSWVILYLKANEFNTCVFLHGGVYLMFLHMYIQFCSQSIHQYNFAHLFVASWYSKSTFFFFCRVRCLFTIKHQYGILPGQHFFSHTQYSSQFPEPNYLFLLSVIRISLKVENHMSIKLFTNICR